MSVPLLAASVGDLYRDGIVETGREPEFLFLLSFLATFGFIRLSTHMIRDQVSWWPGNVETKSGLHIHHLVWGILTVLIVGWFAIVNELGSPGREICAVLFGVGTGLTLDEFALWLNLKDVYWEKQGRRSIDAVIIAASLSGIFLVGLRGWIDAADDVEDWTIALVTGYFGPGLIFALVNAAKEKFGMAIVSVFIPLVGWIGAFRLAKPHSLWARSYGKRRRRRSEERYEGSRGEPFWRRGSELLGRLRLGGARGS